MSRRSSFWEAWYVISLFVLIGRRPELRGVDALGPEVYRAVVENV